MDVWVSHDHVTDFKYLVKEFSLDNIQNLKEAWLDKSLVECFSIAQVYLT